MAILTFLLGALLLIAGLGSLAMSIDLLPTDIGRLWVESGVAFLCAGAVVWAIAALIFKLDRIANPSRRRPANAETAPEPESEPAREPAPAEAPAAEAHDAWLEELPEPTAPEAPAEEEVNYNRRGRLPNLHAVEEAIATPEPQAEIIGRYSAGGSRYDVYSDGSIETETEDGAVRFASMTEFRRFLASRRR